MKWVVWSVLCIASTTFLSLSAAALGTSPSDPAGVKVNGPLLITGYSFTLNQLHYVQIYNNSDSVVSLTGRSVATIVNGEETTYSLLSGLIEPRRFATVAHEASLTEPTFSYDDSVAPALKGDRIVSEVVLKSPIGSQLNNEVANPGMTLTKAYEHDAPITFHFIRNRSASTGNYLTTFRQEMPESIDSDTLYTIPAQPILNIVELFPDAPTCGPTNSENICTDYVKLHNASMYSLDLSRFRLRTGNYGQSSTSSNTSILSSVLEPSGYISVPLSLNSSGGWVWLEDRYGMHVYQASVISYPSSNGYPEQAWSFDDFKGIWRWNIYPTPQAVPNNFGPAVEVNNCSGLKITELSANVASEDQFIEITNMTANKLSIHDCKLQTNRSAVVHSLPEISLEPSERRVIYVKDTSLTLTKTTKGTIYLLSSDAQSEVDVVSYQNLAENTSWSLIDGKWRQTYAATPGSGNLLQVFAACQAGYERNPETGYCRKISIASTASNGCGPGKYRNPSTNRCRLLQSVDNSLKPCAANQYRSQETNRCRLLSSSASSLKTCEPNQFRNPLTNRCKLLTSTASTLKPCSPGQERNPATNRCRKVISNIAADFPVEKVMGGTAQGGLGWLAFGGVGVLAAGYAGWEWRTEMIKTIRRLGTFVSSS